MTSHASNRRFVPNRIDSTNCKYVRHTQTSSYLLDFLCLGVAFSTDRRRGIVVNKTTQMAHEDFGTKIRIALNSYLTHEPTPTETEANKVTAAKKAAIDAEIAGRQLCVEARRDRDLIIAEADADAVERRLAFTKKYGVYELNHYWYPGSIDVSMPFDYFATKSFYLDGFAGFSSGAFEGFKKSENVSLGTNSAYILDNLSTQHMASPFPPATNGAWDAFNPLNANVAAVQKKKANLLYDLVVADIYETYVEAVTAEFRKEEVAALNVARMEYADGLASETALKNAILTARGTALSSYVTALENADSTSNVLTFSSSLLNSSSAYGSSMASAYGDRQIGTRMNEIDKAWRRQCKL